MPLHYQAWLAAVTADGLRSSRRTLFYFDGRDARAERLWNFLTRGNGLNMPPGSKRPSIRRRSIAELIPQVRTHPARGRFHAGQCRGAIPLAVAFRRAEAVGGSDVGNVGYPAALPGGRHVRGREKRQARTGHLPRGGASARRGTHALSRVRGHAAGSSYAAANGRDAEAYWCRAVRWLRRRDRIEVDYSGISNLCREFRTKPGMFQRSVGIEETHRLPRSSQSQNSSNAPAFR